MKEQITIVVDVYKGRVWGGVTDQLDIDIKLVAFNTDIHQVWYRPVKIDGEFVKSAITLADAYEVMKEEMEKELNALDKRHNMSIQCPNCHKSWAPTSE